MPPRALPALAAALAAAPDVDAALAILNEELAAEKGAVVGLLAYDGRREALHDRPTVTPPAGVERSQLAMDHLPVAVRFTVLAGQRFADVGEQGAQYARLLNLTTEVADARLFLKGVVLDGALAGVLGVYEPRRRGGGRAIERVEPLVPLFELAYARFYERDARMEAVAALHEITSRMRAEHAGVVAGLERELNRLRSTRAGVVDQRRLEDAEGQLAEAHRRASAAEERLRAVEEQVTNAVSRLERAHVQLHEQGETVRTQAETIRRLEEQLAAAAPVASRER